MTLAYVFTGVSLYVAFFKPTSAQTSVDLKYLTEHPDEFAGERVVVRGVASYGPSWFGDFWLWCPQGGGIPVILGFGNSDTPIPRHNTIVELEGTVYWIRMEGGYYCIRATSWIYEGYYTILLFEFWMVLLPSLRMASHRFDAPFRQMTLCLITFAGLFVASIVGISQCINAWSHASGRVFAPLISGFHVTVISSILMLVCALLFLIRMLRDQRAMQRTPSQAAW